MYELMQFCMPSIWSFVFYFRKLCLQFLEMNEYCGLSGFVLLGILTRSGINKDPQLSHSISTKLEYGVLYHNFLNCDRSIGIIECFANIKQATRKILWVSMFLNKTSAAQSLAVKFLKKITLLLAKHRIW
jgi:hypothetical protein